MNTNNYWAGYLEGRYSEKENPTLHFTLSKEEKEERKRGFMDGRKEQKRVMQK